MRNWFLIIISFFFFIENGITQEFSLDPVYLDLKAKADSAYKNEDYKLCAECYEKAASYTPDYHGNWNRAAQCYSKIKQFQKAQENLMKAIKLDWDFVEYLAYEDSKNHFKKLKKKKRCWKKIKKAIEAEKSNLNYELRDEIIAMSKNYNQALQKGVNERDSSTREKMILERIKIEESNFRRINEIIAEYGFPESALVGSRTVRRILGILYIEAFKNVKAVEKYLPLLREAARKGDLSKKDVAGFVDIIEVLKGRPQIYGTQYFPEKYGSEFKGILDGKRVNQRRATVGLEPMSEIDKPFIVGYKYKKRKYRESDFNKFTDGWDLVNIRDAETFEITFLPKQNLWLEFLVKGRMRFNRTANICEMVYNATDRGRLIFSPTLNCTKKCCDDEAVTKTLIYHDIIEFELYDDLLFLMDTRGRIWEFKKKKYEKQRMNKAN